MGTFRLQCHPQTPPHAVKAVTVEWRLKAGKLELTYCVEGAGALALPAPAVPARADNLWKTTCFELFLGQAGTAYREFNFSPSGQWATYAFAAYREGGRDAPMPLPPAIGLERAGDAVECRVLLPVSALDGARDAGVTAVIDEGGQLSYWALAHAGAKPDFHTRASFTLAIASADNPA